MPLLLLQDHISLCAPSLCPLFLSLSALSLEMAMECNILAACLGVSLCVIARVSFAAPYTFSYMQPYLQGNVWCISQQL